MPLLVLNARRVMFQQTQLPRNVANAPAVPRRRMLASYFVNDNGRG